MFEELRQFPILSPQEAHAQVKNSLTEYISRPIQGRKTEVAQWLLGQFSQVQSKGVVVLPLSETPIEESENLSVDLLMMGIGKTYQELIELINELGETKIEGQKVKMWQAKVSASEQNIPFFSLEFFTPPPVAT